MGSRTLSILEQGLAEGLHLGAQIHVSLKGQPAIEAVIGESQPGVPMRMDTILLWLSSGKPITALAVAQLWEEGMLQLEAPVARYIPEFGRNGKEAISIFHLLTHTGGFRSADKIPDNLAWDETLERIYETPLEPGWVPGQQAGYHVSSSWFVLAELVQRLSGKPFSEYVREEIFLPLGMDDSWIGMPRTQAHRYSTRLGKMYATDRNRPGPQPLYSTPDAIAACRPGGNIRGPAKELCKFYEGLLATLNGSTVIVKPETLRYWAKPHRVGMYDHTFLHKIDFGLGFVVNSNQYGVETVPYGYGRHSSPEVFGHSGSQSSAGFVDTRHGLCAGWVCNGMPGEPRHQKRARAINTAIYEDLGLA